MKKADFVEIKPNNNNYIKAIKDNKSSKRKKTPRNIIYQFVSAFLICCFLNTTIIAAPRWIVVSANEAYQDFRFNVPASGFFVNVPKWFAGIFTTSVAAEEIPQITRIQIFPGDVTINQGEKVVFTAVAYDSSNAPVSGINFDWTVADTGRGFDPYSIQSGQFEPWVFGTFTVTANGGGFQTQTVVTVNPNSDSENLSLTNTKTDTKEVKTRSISSRSVTGENKDEKKQSETN